MSEKLRGEVTQLLGRMQQGDTVAGSDLMELVYGELQQIAGSFMRRERSEHTLQPTALVNEAALRLLGQGALAGLQGRAHFFGAMAQAMRRVLVDHARARDAQRRGGDRARVGLEIAVELADQDREIDLLALEEALQELEAMNPRQAEAVVLRYFGGLGIKEIADHLNLSVSTVEKDWRLARAWLHGKLGE